MKKPEEPQKRVTFPKSQNFPFSDHWISWNNQSVPLDKFLDFFKKVPTNAQNPRVTLREEWCYDDCSVYLELAWEEESDNPQYEKQMEKYQTKLKKWNKLNKNSISN